MPAESPHHERALVLLNAGKVVRMTGNTRQPSRRQRSIGVDLVGQQPAILRHSQTEAEESLCLLEVAGPGKGVSAEGAVSGPAVVVDVSGGMG